MAATEADWAEEYLAPIISVKVVDSLDEAIAHINRYGSHHTDAILTTNHPNAMRFLREVDSASVMVNASTRFADGFEYGLGAEIGISTDKFHARGPVGLEGLTSLKWVVLGQGEVRTDDAGAARGAGAGGRAGVLDARRLQPAGGAAQRDRRRLAAGGRGAAPARRGGARRW